VFGDGRDRVDGSGGASMIGTFWQQEQHIFYFFFF
jgi:hypothetical protein